MVKNIYFGSDGIRLGSALKVKIRNTHEYVLMAYPLQYLALK